MVLDRKEYQKKPKLIYAVSAAAEKVNKGARRFKPGLIQTSYTELPCKESSDEIFLSKKWLKTQKGMGATISICKLL